jgi:hypothetical protein
MRKIGSSQSTDVPLCDSCRDNAHRLRRIGLRAP